MSGRSSSTRPSSTSSRFSLGGGNYNHLVTDSASNAVLGDVTGRYNLRSMSTGRSQRYSLGGGEMKQHDDTAASSQTQSSGKQDRRAMLEEWRRQVKGRDNNSKSNNKNETKGTTALERFRMRRQQQQTQQKGMNDENVKPTSSTSTSSNYLPPHPTTTSSSFGDCEINEGFSNNNRNVAPEELHTISFTSRVKASSSSSSTTSRGSARRRTRSRSLGGAKRSSTSSRDHTTSSSSHHQDNQDNDMSTPITTHNNNNESNTTNNTIEEAGLKSRVNELQQRITLLEKEKLDLTKSKAPLEARFRKQSDEWKREKTRMVAEIEELKKAVNSSEKKYRSLELKHHTIEEERNKFKYEALRASVVNNNNNSKDLNTSQHVPADHPHHTDSEDNHSNPNPSNTDNDNNNPDNSFYFDQNQNSQEDLELKQNLREAEEEIIGLRLDKVSLEADLDATQRQLEQIQLLYKELFTEYQSVQTQHSNAQEQEIQLQVLTREHIATAAQLTAVRADFASLKTSSQAILEEKQKLWTQQKQELEFQIKVLKNKVTAALEAQAQAQAASAQPHQTIQVVDTNDKEQTNNSNSNSNSNSEVEAILKATIEEKQLRIQQLETQLNEGEILRRKMHNRIQELRGNIRVFVRTRPFLPGDNIEQTQQTQSTIEVQPDGEGLRILDPRSSSSNKLHFQFDKVFPPSSAQEDVFAEVSDFVQSALDGYNVCLFSYGQTGSGKTHTMQGSGNNQMRGIIPRAVEQILTTARSLREHQNWVFDMKVSFVEIYNEELRDLLLDKSTNSTLSSFNRPGSASQKKLTIKRNQDKKLYVDGLSQISIDTGEGEGEGEHTGMQQLEHIFQVAARSRSVASTKMNAQSSRSHSVFMLHLHGRNQENGIVMNGSLNLCDLAGSERLDRSQVTGKRLRETQAINKSLSCLSDVFTSLSEKNSHTPFRNSKLTYLLQDCLSGDGKALMFVNLSPTVESTNESLCSLRFAQRVNAVELGKAKKHVHHAF